MRELRRDFADQKTPPIPRRTRTSRSGWQRIQSPCEDGHWAKRKLVTRQVQFDVGVWDP